MYDSPFRYFSILRCTYFPCNLSDLFSSYSKNLSDLFSSYSKFYNFLLEFFEGAWYLSFNFENEILIIAYLGK